MSKEFNVVVKNSLYAMVDLFLDYVKNEDVDSQRENISEFIIDCHNLEAGEPEYRLLQEKFEEEFSESNYFSELEKQEAMELIEQAIQKLLNDTEIPPLVLEAINDSYE